MLSKKNINRCFKFRIGFNEHFIFPVASHKSHLMKVSHSRDCINFSFESLSTNTLIGCFSNSAYKVVTIARCESLEFVIALVIFRIKDVAGETSKPLRQRSSDQCALYYRVSKLKDHLALHYFMPTLVKGPVRTENSSSIERSHRTQV